MSSRDQKSDLERQVRYLTQYCAAKGYKAVDVLSDVTNGLKTNRRGLLKLFNYVVNRQVDVVVIAYKDRLTRFGFEYLEYFFQTIWCQDRDRLRRGAKGCIPRTR